MPPQLCCVRPSRCPRHAGSAVASSPSLSSGHQSCQSSPTPSPPDHRRAGKLASGAARPAQFRFAASHTRRCPSGSPRSASSSSVCRHGWDLLGGQHMTARDVPILPLRATCSKIPCRNGAASPVTLRVRNCFRKLLWDSGRPSISFDVRPSALGSPRKNARERSLWLSFVSFAIEQACAANGRRWKFPKCLGLPRRLRNAFMPRARIPGGK